MLSHICHWTIEGLLGTVLNKRTKYAHILAPVLSLLIVVSIEFILRWRYGISLVALVDPKHQNSHARALDALLIIGPALYPVILVAFVLRTALPGRKAEARISGMEIRDEPLDENESANIKRRTVTIDMTGTSMSLYTDEWTYNRIRIGDVGIVEYEGDELVGFTMHSRSGSEELLSK